MIFSFKSEIKITYFIQFCAYYKLDFWLRLPYMKTIQPKYIIMLKITFRNMNGTIEKYMSVFFIFVFKDHSPWPNNSKNLSIVLT